MDVGPNRRRIMLKRRELVGHYRLRGLSYREIVEALAKNHDDVFNPVTGDPWTIQTIYADMRRLEKDWQEHAMADVSKHKARLLAELSEIKRQAWSDKDLGNIRLSIGKECDILGLDAAIKIAGDPDNPLKHKIEVEFISGGPGTEPDDEQS